MSDTSNEMRGIMSLVEAYAETKTKTISGPDPEPDPEEYEQDHIDRHPLIEGLREIIFKLRSHTENEDGDRALGVEEGMQRAADMIENALRRNGD